MVAIAALQIDGDILDTIRTPSDTTGEGYSQIQTVEANIAAASEDIAYVYTMRKNELGQNEFIIENTNDEITLGNVYEDASGTLVSSFDHIIDEPVVELDFYQDQWGTWYSGYAPIKNSQGEVIAVLGMDFQANDVLEKEAYLRKAAFLTGLGSLFLVGLFSVYITRTIIYPLRLITQVAKNLARGNSVLTPVITESYRPFLARTDELDEISRSFFDIITYQTG